VTPERVSLRLVAAVATVALLVALVVVLSGSRRHDAGTNGAALRTQKALPAGSVLCQPDELLDAGAAQVVFWAHVRKNGPFEVDVRDATGDLVEKGAVPADDQPDPVVVDIEPLREPLAGATVCIRNVGSKRARIGGRPSRPEIATLIDGRLEEPWVQLRLDYRSADTSSWWAFAPDVAARFGLVKATFFGSWTFWVVLGGVLLLAFGTIWWAARTLAR
jgi:hypothetical protein